MWFLEHESLFGGKRVWLRPGTQQLFGRTKPNGEGKTWPIDNKAVSRQHVTIKVLDILPDAGTKLHTRSQVEITDLSCRQGTVIDGRQTLKSKKNGDGTIEYAKATLDGTEHKIRLAQGYEPFKIYWSPVVFTYASKESKESKARSAQLHALDIKTTTDFVFGKTTHVVTQKRNLPRVLSGLVAGKHIVTDAFLDILLERATPVTDSDFGYVPSPLEESFDEQWPKEDEYMPPTATEPVPRPQEMLRPDALRSEIFANLIFIFLDAKQYGSLHEPITGGDGKALLYEALREGETTVQEYVDYVQSVAGRKKGSRSTNDKLPVITVRLATPSDDAEDWATNFMNGVDRALNQRSMYQNEFLDVILTKDRAALQRPPENAGEAIPDAPESATLRPSPAPGTSSQTPESSAVADELVKSNPRKRTYRAKTTSRFTGFDDYEPPPKIRKTEDTHMEGVQQSVPQATTQPQTQTQTQSRTQSRFAPQSPTHEIVEKEEQMDSLFPAAAEVKRRRAATRAPSPPASVEPEAAPTPPQPRRRGVEALETLQRARQKADKDINVREQTRLRVKEEEERRRADEENLREELDGLDIEQMKNLAVIEEMEMLPRAQRNGDDLRTPAEARAQAKSDRWDPAWNGRKNFKRFRRRGAEQGVTSHKVIVQLEETAQTRSFSGAAFFLEDDEARPRSLQQRMRDAMAAESDSESEQEAGFRGRSRTQSQRPTPAQMDVINVEDSGPDDEEVVEPRTQKSSARTQRVVETQMSEAGAKKRAGGAASEQPATKKGRFTRGDDESDDEETGFRFKRRS
jgi:hypothetical protein